MKRYMLSMACGLMMAATALAQGTKVPKYMTAIDCFGRQTAVILDRGVVFRPASYGPEIADAKTGETLYEFTACIYHITFPDPQLPSAGFNLGADGLTAVGAEVERVEVYDTAGRRIEGAVSADGRTVLRSSLPKGVVIVKAGGKTIKMLNR